MPLAFGIMKPQLPDITRALNEKGSEGWQLKQAILSSIQLVDGRALLFRGGNRVPVGTALGEVPEAASER
jgi:hypothetical protein